MMQSTQSIPGELWPHGMVLSVEDHPHTLREMLWIREAHDLRPHGDDLPPLLAETPPLTAGPAVTADVPAEWEKAWPRLWRAAAAHAGTLLDHALFERAIASTDGSEERRRLMRRLGGPNWREEFGDIAFGEAYRVWDERSVDEYVTDRPRILRDSPERRDLPPLIAAWRAGLMKVVTIRCRGDLAQKITPHALLTTDAIRADSIRYRRALESFAAAN